MSKCNYSRFRLSFRIIVFVNVSTILSDFSFVLATFFFFFFFDVAKEVNIVGEIVSSYVNNVNNKNLWLIL